MKIELVDVIVLILILIVVFFYYWIYFIFGEYFVFLKEYCILLLVGFSYFIYLNDGILDFKKDNLD